MSNKVIQKQAARLTRKRRAEANTRELADAKAGGRKPRLMDVKMGRPWIDPDARKAQQVKQARAGVIPESDWDRLEEETTTMLDKALTAAQRVLLPLLLKQKASDVAAMFKDHARIHMLGELEYIQTGNLKAFDGDGLGAEAELRALFRALQPKS